MSQGNSLTSFAADLSVDRQTIYNWAQSHEEFLGAVKKAKVKCQKWWETRLMDIGSGDKGNVAAVIFALKARFNWLEKEPAEISDAPEESFDTEYGILKSKHESTR